MEVRIGPSLGENKVDCLEMSFLKEHWMVQEKEMKIWNFVIETKKDEQSAASLKQEACSCSQRCNR